MSTASQSVLPLSLPGATSHSLYNGLNIAQGRPSLKKRENLQSQDKSYRNTTTIDMLTDNVLLEIFDFRRLREEEAHIQLEHSSRTVWKWNLLVHVCRRWRQIIFASPRHLHLEIFCTDGTPVRNNLGVWPAIPIVIQYGIRDVISVRHYDEDNVIAALEHPDRVCHVGLHVTSSQLGRIITVMQEPFPVLRCLWISSEDEDVPDIPSGFLAESAPCLQEIKLTGVPFPSLPTLLLSASDLVELNLCDIPETGHISPEVMVASLSTLPKLKILDIGLSPDPSPDQMLLPPITRTALPALNVLSLSGVYESVEDFLARIDTPQLNTIEILYSDELVDFEVPQLSEFINRSENLMRTLSRRCHIMVNDLNSIDFCIGGATGDEDEPWDPDTGIYVSLFCRWMVQQILHLTQVLNRISPKLSNIIHLAIDCDALDLGPWDKPDNFEWLQLLRPFSSVRTLFVAPIFARNVSPVGRDISRVIATEVLPALELLCLEDGPVSSIDKLIAARRDSGRPVTIVDKKNEFDKRLKAYLP